MNSTACESDSRSAAICGDSPAPMVGATSPTGASALVGTFGESCDTGVGSVGIGTSTQRLVEARLGVASGLFAALRAKHPPTAAHSLRVALRGSAWVHQLRLSDSQRDEIEVAALLHDIGKIGVPDAVLLKPDKLDIDELLQVHRASGHAREILRACCGSAAIPDMVAFVPAWFDGRRSGFTRHGENIPLGSRIIAVLDAYDAMTHDQVYRPALPREHALAELYRSAGTQFDPDLVRDFCGLMERHRLESETGVVGRWLRALTPTQLNRWWRLPARGDSLEATGPTEQFATLFQEKLLESLDVGVIFVDRWNHIQLWNRAAERLTGILASSVIHQHWSPALVGMEDDKYEPIGDDQCPIRAALSNGNPSVRRMTLAGRDERRRAIDLQVVPVPSTLGELQGAVVLLHDASQQATFEERLQTLQIKATRDPLTQVANRAEFDRTLDRFVTTQLDAGLPCSLIICDIDHFKQINDRHGHQAGDEALVSFASLLQRHARAGDLVARYGGEEFVMLCADCDNATAAGRADEARAELARFPQSSLDGRSITASFGVTELQPGDTAETFLRRADRALLQAKEQGRNLVVQLGSGQAAARQKSRAGWLAWFTSDLPDEVIQRDLMTPVPLKVAAEKLRGFVADQRAELVSIADTHVVLKLDGANLPLMRRRGDRVVPFLIDVHFEEKKMPAAGRSAGPVARTVIRVTIRPQRHKDRRRHDVMQRALVLLVSLKAYLMAHEYRREPEIRSDRALGVLKTLRTVFAPWKR